MAIDPEDIADLAEAISEGAGEGKTPVRVAREFRDMSRSELANQVGLSDQEAKKLDEGMNPGPMLLKNLALALEVPGDLLVDDQGAQRAAAAGPRQGTATVRPVERRVAPSLERIRT